MGLFRSWTSGPDRRDPGYHMRADGHARIQNHRLELARRIGVVVLALAMVLSQVKFNTGVVLKYIFGTN
jgi:hypothetical protein